MFPDVPALHRFSDCLFGAMEHPLAPIFSLCLKVLCIPKIRILDFFFSQLDNVLPGFSSLQDTFGFL